MSDFDATAELADRRKLLLHLVQNVAIAIQNAEIYREAINNSERATGLLNTIQSVSQAGLRITLKYTPLEFVAFFFCYFFFVFVVSKP